MTSSDGSKPQFTGNQVMTAILMTVIICVIIGGFFTICGYQLGEKAGMDFIMRQAVKKGYATIMTFPTADNRLNTDIVWNDWKEKIIEVDSEDMKKIEKQKAMLKGDK